MNCMTILTYCNALYHNHIILLTWPGLDLIRNLRSAPLFLSVGESWDTKKWGTDLFATFRPVLSLKVLYSRCMNCMTILTYCNALYHNHIILLTWPGLDLIRNLRSAPLFLSVGESWDTKKWGTHLFATFRPVLSLKVLYSRCMNCMTILTYCNALYHNHIILLTWPGLDLIRNLWSAPHNYINVTGLDLILTW